jgi:hypothetical protein
MRKRGEESIRNAYKIVKIIVTDFFKNKMCSLNTTGLRDTGLNETTIMVKGISMIWVHG